MDMQEKYRQQLDISYSYHLAKRMEKHRTNEELGYRTAGSKAELATGEMLAQEMHTIGFPIIHKDAITVDAWEFERAKMTFLNEKGEEETILQLVLLLCKLRLSSFLFGSKLIEGFRFCHCD